jgi:hypothetical protein
MRHAPAIIPVAGCHSLPLKVAIGSFVAAAILVSCDPAYASADDARAPPSVESGAGPLRQALRQPETALRACEILAARGGDDTSMMAGRAAGGTIAFATDGLQGSVVLECVRPAASRLGLPGHAEALDVEA